MQSHGGEVAFVDRAAGADVKGGELNPTLQNPMDKVTHDLTAKAREGKIDPVFGRVAEIRQMLSVLSHRNRNNPILEDEPTMGKFSPC